jgi:hypothetical protein
MDAHLSYALERKGEMTVGNMPTTLLRQLSVVFDKIGLANKLKMYLDLNSQSCFPILQNFGFIIIIII